MTIREPSGLNDALFTAPLCPLRSSEAVPVRASQTFAVLSWLPVTIRVPSGLNDTHRPDRVPFQFEQERYGPRVPDLRRLVLTSGEDPRAVGAERHALHPARVAFEFERGVPVRASHTFAVLVPLPVRIRVPSGLNDALLTALWPFELEQARARARPTPSPSGPSRR